MAFDKTLNVQIFGVTNQAADLRARIRGNSTGNSANLDVNPLRGTLLWDQCLYVMHGVSIAGGATGGSWTVTVETDAVSGFTGLPIASVSGIGPNSPRTIVLTNLHNSPGSPLPTHVFADQTATGGGIWFSMWAIAKQYRGALGTPGQNTSERIIQGTMLRGASFTGGPFTDGRGMTEDATFTLGTSGSAIGLHRMRLWDRAFYWVQAGNSVAGTHNVDIITTVGGITFSIAGTTTGTAGVLDAANERLALPSNVGGQSPNPTGIIWTEVTAGGVSDARIIMMAKSGRGSMAKS